MAPTAPAGTEPNPAGQTLMMVGWFVMLGVMFYFLMIRPQQKQRKQHEQMLRSIKSGDRIITSGGLYGIVTNVKEKSLMVKVADNVKVEIAKTAIATVMAKGGDGEAAGETK